MQDCGGTLFYSDKQGCEDVCPHLRGWCCAYGGADAQCSQNPVPIDTCNGLMYIDDQSGCNSECPHLLDISNDF